MQQKQMNNKERFLAVARFEKPDYMPIFGFRGAPGMSWGCMRHTHERLVEQGMPAGVGGIYPYEVKAGNDLFELREKHPEFLFFGWLEKEVVNEGNERLIEPEIMNKVPPLMDKGGYFPNGDHGIQPPVTFENLCRFMTLLHEVCGNPEGDFPRM